MCGIVGILGREPVAMQLVDALKRLEYRGYDSAGVATLEHGHLDAAARRRQAAAISRARLAKRAACAARSASAIPAGRRMARPTESNAHPHATERVAVVHNGIIENFRELREELEQQRRQVRDRDRHRGRRASRDRRDRSKGTSPVEAVAAALPRLRGAFALAFLFEGEDDLLIGARKGAPLAVGYGEGEMYLGSDAIALAPFTDTHQPISRTATGSC